MLQDHRHFSALLIGEYEGNSFVSKKVTSDATLSILALFAFLIGLVRSRELVVFSNVSTTHSWPPKSPITTTVPHNFQLSTQQHNFFNQSSSTWSKQAFDKQNTGYKATKKQEEHLPYQKFSIWSKNNYMGVSKNRGKTPKMDGENNGKPLSKWNDLGGKPTIFGNLHIISYAGTQPLRQSPGQRFSSWQDSTLW